MTYSIGVPGASFLRKFAFAGFPLESKVTNIMTAVICCCFLPASYSALVIGALSVETSFFLKSSTSKMLPFES